ncbi:MAG TPA: SDR family oxidoreductase, partial [Vicinamibacterales bacterium]|nr:SDR family oxidoreductase [Vicinamibacterales bacterium]
MGGDTILVTGGAGYVGSHVCRKLLERGYRVRVLDNFLYGDKGLAEVRESPDLELRYGDICEAADVRNSVKGCKAVVALAALVGDAACDIDPEEAIAVNFRSTKIMIDECKRHKVERLVFASSCSVYGANGTDLVTEDSPLHPVSLYARTRIMSEELLRAEHGDVDVVNLRLATVCGVSARMRFDLMVNTITARAAIDGKVQIHGPNQWRPHLHVQDAAEAFVRAVAAEEKEGVSTFNVGNNTQNFTIGEIAEKVTGLLPETKVEYTEANGDRRSYRV